MGELSMKYAITGPRGAIFRIVDEEPQQAQHYAPITDEQAQTVNTGEGRFFVIDNQIKTQQEVFAEFRWDSDAGAWGPKPPPPAPRKVEAGKVLGHLASFGVAESDLEDFIKTHTPEGPERIKALNELKRRTHFEIDHPLVIAVASAPPLNITTPEGIAQFFRDAQNYKYA
jgi:hypothetical protein